LSLAANLKDSFGEKVSNKTSSYYTNAPNFPKSLFFNTLLLHLISPVILDPLLSQTLYPNIFNKDVFPQPLAPIIDIN